MNLPTRMAMVLVGLLTSLLGTGTPGSTLHTLAATGGAGLCIAGAAAAHLHWRRPVSDAFAWIGAATYLVFLGSPPEGLLVVLGTALGVVALAIGLHVPAAGAPRMHTQSVLATWIVVAGLALLVAWTPLLMQAGNVVVLDPRTSTGMALRLAATAALLAVGAMLLSLWRRGQHLQEE